MQYVQWKNQLLTVLKFKNIKIAEDFNDLIEAENKIPNKSMKKYMFICILIFLYIEKNKTNEFHTITNFNYISMCKHFCFNVPKTFFFFKLCRFMNYPFPYLFNNKSIFILRGGGRARCIFWEIYFRDNNWPTASSRWTNCWKYFGTPMSYGFRRALGLFSGKMN